MQGKYLGLIPRDSILFFPKGDIRKGIISAYPDIATVSLFRNGLTSISIKASNRVPIAKWCGPIRSPQAIPTASTSTPQTAPTETCYVFDDSGYLFTETTQLPLVNSFLVYVPLSTDANGTTRSTPIGLTLPGAGRFPAAFNLARQLATFGSPVSNVAFRDSEVDEYLESGTRITYVAGHENTAYTALVSGRENLNLANGSLDYVDLRFDGKMYLKRKVDSIQKTDNSQ